MMIVPARSVAALIALAVLVGAAAAVPKTVEPNEISELGLWLMASDLAKGHRDGNPITRWPDRSGMGYDAVFEPKIPQAGLRYGVFHPPTFKAKALGNHPAVSFNADDRQTLILNRAGHALGQKISGFSAVFMVRPTLVYGPAPGPDATWAKNRYLFITHVSNYDTRVSVQVVQDTGEVRVASRPQPQQKINAHSSFADGQHVALVGDAWHRLLVTVDYKEKQTRILLDGTLLTRALPATSLDMFEDVPSPITGIASNTLGDWLTCQIAEMLCYQKALSPEELQALDGYLREKYRTAK
jgi:hypothetical protein